MKLTGRLLFTFFILTAVLITGCRKDEYFLKLQQNSITLGADKALEYKVGYESNTRSIQVQVAKDGDSWCDAEIIDDQYIKITVKPNTNHKISRTTNITVKAKSVKNQTIKVTQLSIEESSKKKLLSFSIPADLNNLKSDIIGIIDESKGLININTDQWIPNAKHLIATFEANGEVFVKGVSQKSGESANSYLNELIFTVKSEDNTEAQFKILANGPMFTGLPILSIYIEDDKEVVEKTLKLPSTLSMLVPENDNFDFDMATMTLRGRGNSSWFFPKKPYRIDFPEKTSMFDLPAAKKWVLLANYQDPTFLMNDVAFELGRRFNMEFTYPSIHLDLFVNGTYRGNYQLTVQKEIGEGRVNIDKNNGLLLELDSYFDEDYKFKTDHFQLPVMVQGPSLNSESEMIPIQEYFQAFENSLFSDGFPNNEYEKHTEVNTLIDFMLINEVLLNRELLWPKSVYCYRTDATSKIKWGPLWDFDWAFSFDYDKQMYFTTQYGMLFSRSNNATNPGALFFNKFLEIPDFVEKYKVRWNQMKPQVLSVVSYIDAQAKKLEKSQNENFKIPDATPPTKNFEYDFLIAQMKQYIADRVEYLDSEINSL